MRNKPYLQLGRGLAVPFTETMHHLGQPSSASAINQHCHTQMYRLAVPATSGVNRKQHVLISVVILLQKTSESGAQDDFHQISNMRVVASALSIAYFASGGILSQEAIQWPRNSTPTGRHQSVHLCVKALGEGSKI